MNTVDVKGVIFNQGRPKICIPLVGNTNDEILNELAYVNTLECEVVEWRIDHYEDVLDSSKLLDLAQTIHQNLKDKVLLTTFRSFKEGGILDIPNERYESIYIDLIKHKVTDLIDIELFMPDSMVKNLVSLAKENQIAIIMCNHDFDKTISKEEIVSRLCQMQDKGADICKIALMPQTKKDVLTLMEATLEMYEDHARCPLISMSMGGLGAISRVSGEVFGSCMSFGVGRKASAPGQISAPTLKETLDLIHDSLSE